MISGSYRQLRGGSWIDPYLESGDWIDHVPSNESFIYGFRVATVPEPSTAVLAILGLAAVLLYWARGTAKCVVATQAFRDTAVRSVNLIKTMRQQRSKRQ